MTDVAGSRPQDARRRLVGFVTALVASVAALAVLVAGAVAGVGRLQADDGARTPGQKAGAAQSTAAPSPTRAGRPATPVAPVPAVKAVLAARAAAVLRRDRTAFLAGVDRRSPAFVTGQSRLFTDLSRLPFASFAYEVVGEYGADRSATYGGRTYQPATVLRFAIRGYDRKPVAEALVFTFVQRGQRWLIASDSDEDYRLPVGGHAQPWDVGPTAVQTGRNVLIIGSAGDRGRLRRLVRTADAAVDEVADTWSTGWSRKVVLIASRDKRVISTYFRTALQPGTSTAAIAVPTYDEVYGWVYSPPRVAETGDRVILHPSVLDGSDDDDLSRLLVHELTHVATRERTGHGSPTWLVEGVAEWTSLRGYEPRLRSAPASLRTLLARGDDLPLPGSTTFYATDVPANYLLSWLVCRYVADTYGTTTLMALYDRFGDFRSQVAALNGEQAAFEDVLGISRQQLMSRVSDSLREQR